MKVSMITTVDNPYDPFNQFDEWFAFDDGNKGNLVHQYFGCNSCQILDRFSFSSSEISPAISEDENERAIDEICEAYKMFGIFKKVSKNINVD